MVPSLQQKDKLTIFSALKAELEQSLIKKKEGNERKEKNDKKRRKIFSDSN